MRGQSGYTLVETLVALMVLAMALTAGLRLVTNAIAGADRAERRIGALLLAQSLLEGAGLAVPLDGSGRDGAYAWRLSAAPLPVPDDAPLAALQITATVAWEGGALDLATVKLGPRR
ncbi:MAG TPA: type II secretion system protein [Alphaproteobacteria bacterium]|nr:type II secretion system protein [Alphaproteobacteria bacterium]